MESAGVGVVEEGWGVGGGRAGVKGGNGPGIESWGLGGTEREQR